MWHFEWYGIANIMLDRKIKVHEVKHIFEYWKIKHISGYWKIKHIYIFTTFQEWQKQFQLAYLWFKYKNDVSVLYKFSMVSIDRSYI